MSDLYKQKIILPGGAGLVGQNLVVRLKQSGFFNIIVIDKHRENLDLFKTLHPDIVAVYADLSVRGVWHEHFHSADVVVMLQAQIGSKHTSDFFDNNVKSTVNIFNTLKECNSSPYVIHISSSVVESVANDDYTNTKKEQENIVLESDFDSIVLRPTLMFGWFDRKHLGWLSRFMKKIPVFPIPGHGKYSRQPLFVGDFCNIIISCLDGKRKPGIYNISGSEHIDYIDIIKTIKQAVRSKTVVIKIPYSLFYMLLRIWGLFDPDPPFTIEQLRALVAGDEFEDSNWPDEFNVEATPFDCAIKETFQDEKYGKVVLRF